MCTQVYIYTTQLYTLTPNYLSVDFPSLHVRGALFRRSGGASAGGGSAHAYKFEYMGEPAPHARPPTREAARAAPCAAPRPADGARSGAQMCVDPHRDARRSVYMRV